MSFEPPVALAKQDLVTNFNQQFGMNFNNQAAPSAFRSPGSGQPQGGQQSYDPQLAAMFQTGGMNADQQNSLNISNEIKRLQQLHQMNAGASAPSNALLMPGAQRTAGPDTSIFQSMMDQKVQNPRFDNPLAQTIGNTGFNPMLQPSFLQDARLFMAQNQFNMAGMNSGMRQPEIPLPAAHSLFHRDGSRRMRGGVIEPFPEKLHRLLLEVEAAGRSDVISFVANGRAFAIHKPDKFFKEIVPLYFRQSRLSSFKRQLNLYGFELINTGPARGGYYHELFVKDRPELCRRMRRVAVKVSTKQDKDDKDNSSAEVGLVSDIKKDPGDIDSQKGRGQEELASHNERLSLPDF